MIRIGVLCPAEIAKRRFMPALLQCPEFSYVGVGMHRREKAEAFLAEYPGKLFESYEDMVSSDEIDAVYIPLPPALHFQWANKALQNGKHVLLEKPFTMFLSETETLISEAKKGSLALHENYMFVFHRQMEELKELIKSGEIGEVRLYRMSFGFPMRPAGDFRYDRTLGGGALMDAGGYCLKLATWLLGDSAHVKTATANRTDQFDVDLYGSATLVNEENVTAQVSFGMDNQYKCELQVWGSKGMLTTGRIFTAPAGFAPTAVIETDGNRKEIPLSADDTFFKSISQFAECIERPEEREQNYREIMKQAELVEEFRKHAGM